VRLFGLPDIFRFLPVIFVILVLCGCPKPAIQRQMSSPRQQPKPAVPVADSGEKEGEQVESKKENSRGLEKTRQIRQEKAETENQTAETADASTASDAENNPEEGPVEKSRDLGPPLVDNPETLKKLHPVYPVWIDNENKQVVMLGEICQTNVPLEMFACPRGTKEHESIVEVPTESYIVHSGLLAGGAMA